MFVGCLQCAVDRSAFPSCSIQFYGNQVITLFSLSHFALQIPHNLFKEQGYDHREALFGVPLYGGSIATNLYYADSDLCDPNVDTSKGYPSRPIKDGKMESWPSPFILMVDRGGCTFVKKVRHRRQCQAR